MTALFRVQLTGSTLSGASQQARRAEVGAAFGLNERQLDQMLCGKPVTVSKRCDTLTAQKLLTKLARLDLEARMEALPGEVATPATSAANSAARPVPVATPVPPPVVAPRRPVPPAGVAAAASPVPASPADAYSPVRDYQPMEYFSGIDYTPYPETLAAEKAAQQQAGEITGMTADIITCPQCHAVQPKRTLCRQCGLDMPRYLAAQAAQARAAVEQRLLERDIRLQQRQKHPASRVGSDDDEAETPLLGFGFGGRLGRLDYFSSSLFSSGIYAAALWLALKTGIIALVWISLALMLLFGLRCLALRLHDTGRSGWLGLLVLVPVLGWLLALLLLFVGGDADENDYGLPPRTSGAGKRLLMALVTLVLGYALLSQATPQGVLHTLRQGPPAGQVQPPEAPDAE